MRLSMIVAMCFGTLLWLSGSVTAAVLELFFAASGVNHSAHVDMALLVGLAGAALMAVLAAFLMLDGACPPTQRDKPKFLG